MKICVSSVAKSLDAKIDSRFGRCPYFIIVDSETMAFEVVSNIASNAMGGAGIQAAQTVTKKGVKVVVTGNVGPNAFKVLSAAGIRIVTGVSGTVKEAVESYTRGELNEISAPSVSGHYGMGKGPSG